jgi:small subunit ribosomal protein S6
MTRQYEAVYIFDSALDETAVDERLDRFHTLLAQPTDETPDCNHWGKRVLAYPIKNHESGYYVIATFESATEALPEYERAVKLDESVLRFLLVLNDGPQPVPPREEGPSDKGSSDKGPSDKEPDKAPDSDKKAETGGDS